MKKILFTLFSFLFVLGAHSAQVANVEYIHNLVKNKWDITIPYSPDLVSEKQAANMEYLLTVVDIANRAINKKPVTNYGQSNFATRVVVDTIAVNQAVETLISRKYDFFMTVADTDWFYFDLEAAGEFYIDWGDGQTETIINTDVEFLSVEHNYAESGTYRIKMGGLATGYNDDEHRGSTVYFYAGGSITKLEGSIGAIFKTLPDGTQPSFSYTFPDMYELTSIPETLFTGISGAPAEYMFYGTFSGCSGLTSIPENLFAGISGAPAEYMFTFTFSGCSGLTSIPENLFGNISGTAQYYMFNGTFENCTSLTGPSARINGQYLYEIWPDATVDQAGDMYKKATGLSDYDEIPLIWGGNGAVNPTFTLTTTPDTDSFSFVIGAGGTFLIDWGDGNKETINKSTGERTYSHTYNTAGAYTIKLDGKANYYINIYDVAAIRFNITASSSDANVKKIASIDGSLGAIFGTLASGTNKQPRFYQTFSGASNMNAIPANLFAGISGAPATYMFYNTFSDCSGLTSIPDGLFAGISGAPAQYMFYQTFRSCRGLTGAIPAGLFAGISGAPAQYMFCGTFSGCRGLTGAIPAGLFAGISGAPAQAMFENTFYDCGGLISIPENLFADISGAPARYMFYQTFYGCSGLTGAIPAGLFGNLTGAPASNMFYGTFAGCSGLTGAIPAGLFGNLTGAPASNMFYSTFFNCSGLTSIPSDLFAGISGAPAGWMFDSTFEGCEGLTSIPENLFGNISGTAQNDMFGSTFSNCTSLTGPSARINGQYLYEIWPDATEDQVGSMYTGATGLEDYRCIPTVWGGLGEDCSVPVPEFTLTTTDDTDSFEFSISAAGEFVVDWGDGTVETITKPDTTNTTYSHDYDTAGAYTIGLSGQATAYDTDEYTAAISFEASSYQIASIDGSLGTIFGTLSSDTNNQPRFYMTFSYAPNMTGSIPSDLFAGISGAPASNMFAYTFDSCSGLTGAIPDGLFAGISGAPASNMFEGTFWDCSGLTSIPAGLFAGISGAPASYMFAYTFEDCSGLTSVPDGLFAGISGAPAEEMFAYTFEDCSGLTSIPAGLFAGISGAPARYMFDSTFYGCRGLKSIPENLFAGISGAPAYGMFASTFNGCEGLTSIPENLFGNISGTATSGMFASTFYNCTSLTGPSARINGQYLYEIWPSATSTQVGDMYYNATGLSDYLYIPVLWGGLGVTTNEYPSAPSDAVYNFYLTTTSDTDVFTMQISAAGEFYIDWGDGKSEWITKSDTTNMTFGHKYASKGAYNIKLGGQATAYKSTAAISFYVNSSQTKIASIDGSLGAIFGTLSSDTNNQPRFYYTFYNATNMKGSIPSDLFAGISGAPASDMFKATFEGCSGLTGAIPDGLFGNLTGAPASRMFESTFEGCSGLTSIPENLFGNISGTANYFMFYRTFYNCTSLTGPSARINGQYLYEIWPDAAGTQVGDMYTGATGLSDYRCIPTVWGGSGDYCGASAPEDTEYKFFLTTTSDTNSFSFSISAAGEFYVDWGDGKTGTITKIDTTNTTYSHTYSTSKSYTIKLAGQATAYNTSTSTAAIKFYVNSSQTKIASIDGSLGAIFGTLSSDTNNQPRFYQTFSGASNMTGSIPSDLFTGISGAPASYMFQGTFSGCSGLTGTIPDGLFAGISGAPAERMFSSTFSGCSGLTGAIPDGLFAGISGAPASHMFFFTFNGCSGLTSIPENLFGNLTGAPAQDMFASTFYNCSGLTGAIPDGLFGNLTGKPASYMFDSTFYGCSGLTSIPENLFGNISGTARDRMFYQTFYNCTSLTGPSARINGQYLYEIWPSATSIQVRDMYYNATGLSDYSNIPTVWK